MIVVSLISYDRGTFLHFYHYNLIYQPLPHSQFSILSLTKLTPSVMGYTSDSLPHVGRIPILPSHPSRSRPYPSTPETKYIAAGFNGHGMPVIFRATKALAAMILTGKSFEDTDVPAVFQTSAERLLDSRNDLGSRNRKS